MTGKTIIDVIYKGCLKIFIKFAWNSKRLKNQKILKLSLREHKVKSMLIVNSWHNTPCGLWGLVARDPPEEWAAISPTRAAQYLISAWGGGGGGDQAVVEGEQPGGGVSDGGCY